MVLVRGFTSIFISTRRQLFTLAAGVANHSANSSTEYEGAILNGAMTASHLEGKGQEPRKDYVCVWEKTGGFKSDVRLIISRRDTPF